MKYEILGKVFRSTRGKYLELNGCNYTANDLFNDAMGFDGYHDRNRFIEEELGISCSGVSPQFNTYQELEAFIDWFKDKYERQRIILKRGQIKNFCNGV